MNEGFGLFGVLRLNLDSPAILSSVQSVGAFPSAKPKLARHPLGGTPSRLPPPYKLQAGVWLKIKKPPSQITHSKTTTPSFKNRDSSSVP